MYTIYTCTHGSSASEECHTYITLCTHGNSASLSVILNDTVPLSYHVHHIVLFFLILQLYPSQQQSKIQD